MKKKIGIIALVLAVLIAVIAAVVAMQPSEFQIERSASILAPPSAPFKLVNDFHHWEKWSPWAKLDPNMETTYEGPESGVGAIYTWKGNSEVGEGRMTIAETTPDEHIEIRLEFMKPFEATSKSIFTFAPEGDGTSVTWRMEGANDFMGKAFGLLMDMDAMIGQNFEDGLADMKKEAEGETE